MKLLRILLSAMLLTAALSFIAPEAGAQTNLAAAESNSVPYFTSIQPNKINGAGTFTILGNGVATNGNSLSPYLIPTNSNNTVASGSTNYVWGSQTTSSNLTLDVSRFDDISLTYQHTGLTGATNGTEGLTVYASYDGGAIWNPNPVVVATNNESAASALAAGGTYTFTFTTNNFAPGATTLAFVLQNGTTNYVTGFNTTNVSAELTLKAPTQNSIQQGYGTGGGTLY